MHETGNLHKTLFRKIQHNSLPISSFFRPLPQVVSVATGTSYKLLLYFHFIVEDISFQDIHSSSTEEFDFDFHSSSIEEFVDDDFHSSSVFDIGDLHPSRNAKVTKERKKEIKRKTERKILYLTCTCMFILMCSLKFYLKLLIFRENSQTFFSLKECNKLNNLIW